MKPKRVKLEDIAVKDHVWNKTTKPPPPESATLRRELVNYSISLYKRLLWNMWYHILVYIDTQKLLHSKRKYTNKLDHTKYQITIP